MLKEGRQKVLITAETNKLWSCGADSSQRKQRGKYLDLLIYEELSQWDEFGCTQLSREQSVLRRSCWDNLLEVRKYPGDVYIFWQCKHHKGGEGLIYGLRRSKGQKQAKRDTGWFTDRVRRTALWNSYLRSGLTFLSLNPLKVDCTQTYEKTVSKKQVFVFERRDWMDVEGNGSLGFFS